MLKIFKSKKGLTLMELIVGMLMFSIIGVAVSLTLAPTLMAYTRANDFAEYNTLLDNVANQIINDLSQLTQTPVIAQDDITITTSKVKVRYFIENGILMKEIAGNVPWPVFADDFYKRKDVSFTVTSSGTVSPGFATTTSLGAPYTLTLTVRLTERVPDGNAAFELERDYAVRPLMLNQA